ncbi:helix-turn-helix domain-containing protein [Cerasicoccus frondis]|uniref:helix-turn-helix domain-containing protein n=1 Tax=Cerasicoccus frondis TaxID=490090 RepID=UPI002852D440|nr:helix-turn-helix transcriptional regulator [Cerasicoccus frondis]
MSETLRVLGDRIRQERKSQWTQEEFAAKSGIDRSYYGTIERGQQNISFLTLCKICAHLGCDVAKLTHDLPVD